MGYPIRAKSALVEHPATIARGVPFGVAADTWVLVSPVGSPASCSEQPSASIVIKLHEIGTYTR